MRPAAQRLKIALLGPPGSGKTTVGRALAQRLGCRAVDFDDDVLEVRWRGSVAGALGRLGDDGFLAAEADELRRWTDAHGSSDDADAVLSLSGSNGLDAAGVRRLAASGWTLVYLDAAASDIEARCQRMKIDRIVGQAAAGLRAVLQRRAGVYARHYHVRLDVADGDAPEALAERLLAAVAARRGGFVSTRGHASAGNYADVLRDGVAGDGGLFCPAALPPVWSPAQLASWQSLPFPALLQRVLDTLPCGNDVQLSGDVAAAIAAAYASYPDADSALPVRHHHGNVHLLEAYHGPTASFKDLSLQLLPRLLRLHAAPRSGVDGLLVATSGDTGTAALDGFARAADTPTIVLYPHGGVSSVQEAQMRSAAASALVVGVSDADFDGCQAFVKRALAERLGGDSVRLSSANSMNWGRLAPQIAYSVAGYFGLLRGGALRSLGEPLDVCYPTGNFGNVLGAIVARRLGLPLRRIVCASNENRIVADFLRQRRYDLRGRCFVRTNAPAMDILVASNLERLLYLAACEHRDHAAAAALVRHCYRQLAADRHFDLSADDALRRSSLFGDLLGDACSQPDCVATIERAYRTTGQLLDPHTAVGVCVAERHALPDAPMLVCATAHYAKFPETVLASLGHSPDAHLPAMLAQLQRLAAANPLNAIPATIVDLPSRPVNHSLVLPIDHVPAAITSYLQRFH